MSCHHHDDAAVGAVDSGDGAWMDRGALAGLIAAVFALFVTCIPLNQYGGLAEPGQAPLQDCNTQSAIIIALAIVVASVLSILSMFVLLVRHKMTRASVVVLAFIAAVLVVRAEQCHADTSRAERECNYE